MSAISSGQDNLLENLQKYFGFDAFKAEQQSIIQSLLDGHDTFVIMPTGGGKILLSASGDDVTRYSHYHQPAYCADEKPG
jgi:hypothetical protein